VQPGNTTPVAPAVGSPPGLPAQPPATNHQPSAPAPQPKFAPAAGQPAQPGQASKPGQPQAPGSGTVPVQPAAGAAPKMAPPHTAKSPSGMPGVSKQGTGAPPVPPTPAPWVRAERAVKVLERIGTPEAIQILQTLSQGEAD